MPPRIPKGLSKKKRNAPSPVTSEDFRDAGVDEEENGERWIDSGDVPKALRFYRKAQILYEKAVELGKASNGIGPNAQFANDAAYNVARMQYMIYSKVVKTGLIADVDARTLADVQHTIPANLDSVARVCAIAMNLTHGQVRTDLLFTNGQVLAELGEDREDLGIMSRAAESFQQVLQFQIGELNKGDIYTPAETVEEAVVMSGTRQAKEQTEEIYVHESVTPSSTVETIVNFVDCINTLLELCRDEDTPFITPAPAVANYTSGAISGLHEIVRHFLWIVTKYGVEGTENSTFTSVSSGVANEAAIGLARVLSTCAESLEVLISVWTADQISVSTVDGGIVEKALGMAAEQTISLPETCEKLLVASDALVGYTERPKVTNESQWAAMSHASVLLKKAWEMVNNDSQAPVATRLKVLIVRGDIEVIRARMDVAVAIRNKETLQKNAINLYMSAVNLPMTSGMSISAGGTVGQLLKREANVKLLIAQGREQEARTVKGYDYVEKV